MVQPLQAFIECLTDHQEDGRVRPPESWNQRLLQSLLSFRSNYPYLFMVECLTDHQEDGRVRPPSCFLLPSHRMVRPRHGPAAGWSDHRMVRPRYGPAVVWPGHGMVRLPYHQADGRPAGHGGCRAYACAPLRFSGGGGRGVEGGSGG